MPRLFLSVFFHYLNEEGSCLLKAQLLVGQAREAVSGCLDRLYQNRSHHNSVFEQALSAPGQDLGTEPELCLGNWWPPCVKTIEFWILTEITGNLSMANPVKWCHQKPSVVKFYHSGP